MTKLKFSLVCSRFTYRVVVIKYVIEVFSRQLKTTEQQKIVSKCESC